jgi:hypothetical protein
VHFVVVERLVERQLHLVLPPPDHVEEQNGIQFVDLRRYFLLNYSHDVLWLDATLVSAYPLENIVGVPVR